MNLPLKCRHIPFDFATIKCEITVPVGHQYSLGTLSEKKKHQGAVVGMV